MVHVFRVNKCKYMDSKKKPLFLVFENADPGADDVYILFKNGDGNILYFTFALFYFIFIYFWLKGEILIKFSLVLRVMLYMNHKPILLTILKQCYQNYKYCKRHRL